jgi:hypothetical protein
MAEYVGTAAATKPTDASVPTGAKYWETDTDKIYEWDGDSWVLKSVGGAALVTDPNYTTVIYESGGYTYLCKAAVGTARSTEAWRVLRITDSTGDGVYAGTGLPEHAATDAATVAALTYTLGA